MIELMPDGWLLLLLDRLSRKLLEGGGHHIHIASLEEDDVARRLFCSVLLECIVNPVFVGSALEALDME